MARAQKTKASAAAEPSPLPETSSSEQPVTTLHGKPVAREWLRLGYLVHDVSRMRRTAFDRHMKPLGITRSQWWVLANLSRHDTEDGMMQTELARLIGVGKVTLGGLVDRLEEAGYVRRKVDKNDRRAKRVLITKAGYSLIGRMAVEGEKLTSEFTVGIPEDEIRQAEDVLHRIKLNLARILVQSDTAEPDTDANDEEF